MAETIKMSEAATSCTAWRGQDKELPNWIVKGRQRVNKTCVERVLKYLCRATFCLCFFKKREQMEKMLSTDMQRLPKEPVH